MFSLDDYLLIYYMLALLLLLLVLLLSVSSSYIVVCISPAKRHILLPLRFFLFLLHLLLIFRI